MGQSAKVFDGNFLRIYLIFSASKIGLVKLFLAVGVMNCNGCKLEECFVLLSGMFCAVGYDMQVFPLFVITTWRCALLSLNGVAVVQQNGFLRH